MRQNIQNKMRTVCVIVCFATVCIPFAGGQAQDDSQERRREEEIRKALEETELKILEGEERLRVDYGGWVSNRYEHLDDDDNDRTARDSLRYSLNSDVRVWMKAVLTPLYSPNTYSIYVRMKNDTFWVRRPEDTNKSFDNNGPHLDYAYATLDVLPWTLETGRRYFNVGQGIAYGDVHDGIELSFASHFWTVKGFASHTLPHGSNADTSVPGFDKTSDRSFYGLEANSMLIPSQSFYGYYLVQQDESDPEPPDGNEYDYDSQYAGLGLQGKLTSRIHCWAELIRETGSGRVYATGEKKEINAWAADTGITWDFDTYAKPNLTAEYAFASGDPDRASVTDTRFGNSSGDDRNFLYCGYLPTGYALSPQFSNLYFYKISLSGKPWETLEAYQNLTLGVDYYQFFKSRKEGGISDADATESDNRIGSEIDCNLNWKILSDLSCTLEYGYFMPSAAYPAASDDAERYFSLDVRLTF